MMEKKRSLADMYLSESTQRELSIEYQRDRVQMVVKYLWVLVLWMKVDVILEGLSKFSCTYTI